MGKVYIFKKHMLFMQIPHTLELTGRTSQGVLHYTCNPPSMETLNQCNIQCLGTDYGCDDSREVVLIPYEVFTSQGIPIGEGSVLKINAERLLRNLEKKVE